MMSWIVLILSLIAMALGADWLVRGCTYLARKIGVSEFILSMLIIGIGTTTPEIIISLISSANGHGTLVVSNAIASNTIRILGVLGLGALLHPIITNGHQRKIDIYFVFLATIAMMWAISDGVVSKLDGFVLFSIFVAYALVHWIKTAETPEEAHTENIHIMKIIVPLTASIAALYFGSRYFMDALNQLTSVYDLDDTLAGIMIVAPGTSAPEILITIVAATRRRGSIILGNILGSNLANICLAVAASTMFAPLPVSPHILSIDIWVLIAATTIFSWQMLHFRRLSRLTGIIYITLLVVYFLVI